MMRICNEECSGDSEVGVPVKLDAIGGLAREYSFMSRDPVLKRRFLAQLSNSIAGIDLRCANKLEGDSPPKELAKIVCDACIEIVEIQNIFLLYDHKPFNLLLRRVELGLGKLKDLCKFIHGVCLS